MLPYDEKWCHYHRDLSRLLEPKSVGWCTSNTQVLTPHLNVGCRSNSVLGDSQKWLGEILVRWRMGRRRGEGNISNTRKVASRYVLRWNRTGSSPVLTTTRKLKYPHNAYERVLQSGWYKVGSSPMEGYGWRVAPCREVRFLSWLQKKQKKIWQIKKFDVSL